MRFMNPFRHFRDHHHFGHHFGGGHHHRGRGDASEFLEFIVARASSKLDLNEKQQELLAALLKDLQAQRAAMKSGLPDFAKNLLAGETFDRAAAQQALDARVDAVRAAGPGVINAAGDFFDSLDAEQKQALRFLLRTRSRRFS
ncbi:Spy/CpxP family protein refolding chaperone [Pelomonas sp. KK5]|uniref:Spy/CpxP family protein refolding chaperone n=1 Tax=Pelomonas sp. KK5 TaxID=1855730 RepID=UPI00097C1556|nr:Spy/CpxP family protein refolding chaperone [Pelomonas sp. KK5]